MRNIYLIGIVVLLSSCARILNGPFTKVTIVTDTTAKVIFNKDTLPENTLHRITIRRNKDSLKFTTIINDSLKNYNVAAINSAAFYLNIYTLNLYGLGFILDHKSFKRYTYPQKIWVRNQQAYDYYHKNPNFDFENTIKITPLKLASFIYPSFELSYERKLNRYFSSNVIAGLIMQSYLSDNYRNMNGCTLGTEQRYYFKKSAPLRSYLAFETIFFKASYQTKLSFYDKAKQADDTDNGYKYYENTYSDNVGIRKKTFNINLKYGYQHKFPNRILFDVYAGIGARLRNVRHLNRTFPEDPMSAPRHPNVHYLNNKEGKYWTLHIPLNFKIGYSF